MENVSRETLERLQAFEGLVRKWTAKINLVSVSTLNDLWERHIVDSYQVFDAAPSFGRWVDVGSGGGFPGIVVAIRAAEACPDARITLVESDQRKCVFLRTVARELGLGVTVKAARIETLAPLGADVLSARAVDSLTDLLSYAHRHLSPGGTALFPKGANWRKEHEEAQKHWSYTLQAIKSVTEPEAAILKIKDIARV